MPDLAIGLISADRNIMANLNMDPLAAFDIVATQANAFLQRYPGAHIVIAPEYFMNERLAGNAGKPEVMTRSEKHSTYRSLEEISSGLGTTILVAGTIFYKKGLRTKLGLNVCPVLQNGKIIYKYYKVFDDGSLTANAPNAAFDTKPTSPIFTASGITFGVEICGDTADANAFQRNWNSQYNSGAVQVHIVIADGSGMFASKIQAGANGVAILTDLASGATFVRQSPTGQWVPASDGPNAGRAPFNVVQPEITSVSQATGAGIDIYRVTI